MITVMVIGLICIAGIIVFFGLKSKHTSKFLGKRKLTFSKDSYAPGEKVEFSLEFTPNDNVQIHSLELYLVCSEEDAESGRDEDVVNEEIYIGEKIPVNKGIQFKNKYSVYLPKSAQPSEESENFNRSWFIEELIQVQDNSTRVSETHLFNLKN